MTFALGIVAFAVLLLLAVLIHELGHLLMAKLFGMRADRYFVGFGPTLWSTRRGETEYGVKALPLGGFVAIRGMNPYDERRPPVVDEVFSPEALARDRQRSAVAATDEAGGGADTAVIPAATWQRLREVLRERGTPPALAERIVTRTRTTVEGGGPETARRTLSQVLLTEVGDSERLGDLAWRLERGDEGRFYHDRPVWQRACTIAFGPLTHLGIAFVLLLVAYLFIPLPTGEPTNEVDSVLDDSPAAEAGIEPGDEVVAVEELRSEDFLELREVLRQRPGEPTTLTVERAGEPREIELVPSEQTDERTGETVGVAGFVPVSESERLSGAEAVRRAAIGSEQDPVGGVVPMVGASVEGLARVFSPSGIAELVAASAGTEERDPEGAVSVVGIASIAGQTAGEGLAGVYSLLFILAFLNVILFIFNLVPLPPFDGGHLAVLGVEKLGNLLRRLRGRPQTFTVDPRTITAVAVPVIGLLLVVFVTTLWLDIVDPISL
ncbi:MAG: M50 family metallopeptidase [Nitriliruptoraceae bacterium]